MKKIGVITYHKAYNYGSVLQAYALNKYLRCNGFETETIDYRTDKQDGIYRIFEPIKGIVSLLRNIQSLIQYGKLRLQKERFNKFLSSYVPLSKRIYKLSDDLQSLDYDYYICGSDQIWNPTCTDFDDAYLLSFVSDKAKCISYAPSIGVNKLSQDQLLMFHDGIIYFKAISLREEEGADLLSSVLGCKPQVVLDPVFLLENNEWESLAGDKVIKKPYIFGYFIGDVPGMRSFANELHKNTNLPIVVAYKSIRDLLIPTIKRYDSGPQEFLSLIKNAEYIVANSFHAVLFSVIFRKNFWVFVESDDESNKPQTRIYNIASKLGLTDRILSLKNCDIDYDKPIDYENVVKILEAEKKKSIDYLLKALED